MTRFLRGVLGLGLILSMIALGANGISSSATVPAKGVPGCCLNGKCETPCVTVVSSTTSVGVPTLAPPREAVYSSAKLSMNNATEGAALCITVEAECQCVQAAR